MAFTPQNPSLGYPPIDKFIDATGDDYVKPVPYGTIITATDPVLGSGEFIFLKGVASTAVGSWVTYNADDYSTTLTVANAIGPVAVAMSACVAGKAGWYQISGKAIGKAATSFADNANVYLTATAGVVDDATVAGDLVFNAKGASAVDSETGLAEFEIARPFVKDGLDDAVGGG